VKKEPTVNIKKAGTNQGFTLLEMMVSMALLLVIAGAAFSALNFYQKSYASTEAKIDTVAGMRNAMELLAQEVEQAGAIDFTAVTLSGSVLPGNSAVAVTSAAQMYVGEILTVDAGTAAQETVAITGLTGNTVRGVFANSHSAGASVDVIGVMPQGVLASSNATQLQIIGDINGDGNLVYVRYTCDLVNGALTRDTTPINATARSTPVALVDNLIANPQGQPCFSYNTVPPIAGYNFTTNVAVQLTSQTQGVDMTTRSRPNTFDILNLSPRNVVAARLIASAGATTELQPVPVNSAIIP
jgi:prepilin-type N-terminal cleavage/methylation domain-containing protein